MEETQDRNVSLLKDEFLVTIGTSILRLSFTKEGQVTIDGKEYTFDLKESTDRLYTLLLDNAVYEGSVVNGNSIRSCDGDSKDSFRVTVNGTDFDVIVDDHRSLLLKSLLKSQSHTPHVRVVRAPMPGLVVKVEVAVGDGVRVGQGLLVLEAMKMENEIKALQSGRIDAVYVNAGRAVEKGEPLISMMAE